LIRWQSISIAFYTLMRILLVSLPPQLIVCYMSIWRNTKLN
jgi:hypothetical protein